ncbi:DUF6531 domain-containing protein [Streptomyces sp. DSM 44915]|uniref:DUF6531 domain-containing protein n=1 Tax=Streptomyces chisholmiae TaxID=3075540 RepID=A0ABU2JLG2_9ACTN|nr:DUF6531 domain-containing protein [Streptomyces sp. DSM 44915]MDT0265825.1 DUF6531 domain-containing protein [Streptomyces sp. DSM 44915]
MRAFDWSPVDMDRDPTPGDPDEVRELADDLQHFADDVGEALGKIRGMAGERAMLDWAGLSADAFRREFDGVPDNLTKLEDSYSLCAQALHTYWPKLQTAQGMADRALDRAIAAQTDLVAAQSALGDATDWVGRAAEESERLQRGGERDNVEPPDEHTVRAAARDQQAAETAASAAQGRVDSAEERLSAARQLALEAQEMREEAARECARDIGEASDAGIQNRRWWEKAIDWVTDNWDTLVEICKVVVAVLGVVVLIIGGPLTWVVLAAAVVVLADTLIKYARGEVGLLDVAFAALDCIPGGRGITTAAGLAAGMRNMGRSIRNIGRGGLRGADDVPVPHDVPPSGRCVNGHPVDMVSGEMITQETDVILPGVLPVVLRRTYLSTYQWGRFFGASWASTLDERLEIDEEGVRFATEDGMILVYPIPRPGRPTLPTSNSRRPLTWSGRVGDRMLITDPDSGWTRHFAPMARAPQGTSAFTLYLVEITDRNGNRVSIDRDEAGLPQAVRHAAYHIDVDIRSDRILRLRLRDASGEYDGTELRRYAYTVDGLLREDYNSSGIPTVFDYDERARIICHTDRNGHWYRFAYDDQSRCVVGEGEEGVLSCVITYDSAQRSTRYTDSRGHTRTYRHDDRFRLVEVIDPLGGVVRNTFDEAGRLVARTDPLGHTRRQDHDDEGNLVAIQTPDGNVTRAAYNERHQVVQAVMPDGRVWRHDYDDSGNHVFTRDPSGTETRYAYDATGALVGVTDAAGRTSRARANAAGLPVRFTDARGAVSGIVRDAFGRVTCFTDPLGHTTRFGWTVEGKIAWRQDQTGNRETWEWDGEGNLVSHTDRAGSRTRYAVGPFGQVTSQTKDSDSGYAFAYDTELNLLRVTNPAGQVWTYTYDAANRVASETDFGGRALNYEVDAAGGLVSRTNGADERILFCRDELGRTVEMYHDGVTAYFTYDSSGNIVREANSEVVVEREYSPVGLLLSEAVNGRRTTFTYDALGRRTGRRTPSGIESTWTYDASGSPLTLITAGHRIDFEFDHALRERVRRLPGGAQLTQSWNEAGLLVEQRLARATEQAEEALLEHRTYAYRPDGVLTAIDELTSGTRRFDLDTHGRVTAVNGRNWTETYAYDAIGNISAATTPGTGDERAERTHRGTRITHSGRTRYERDPEGRVVRIVHRLLNGQKRQRGFSWDSQSRLVGATTPEGIRWRYVYDPAGRRVAKQRLDSRGGVADQTLFVWDGARLIEQITDGGHATSWDYAPGSHRPLAQVDRTDIDVRFHAIVADLSGAPTELVSAEGNIAWRHRTTLWGIPLPGRAHDETSVPATGGVECPLRFPGQYADAETGWHYNYQRYYDPQVGQYATADPLGLAPGPHDSGYVPNPYSASDPLGLAWQDPNNGMRFGRDPSLPPPAEGGREFTRGNQYPSEYWQGTHDYMTANYTDEGRAAGGTPLDSDGNRIPRDQLTWRDGANNVIWDPHANNPKPFSRTVTYEHLDPVVEHWNNTGRFSDRATRNSFYNHTERIEPMDWSQNSAGGGRMTTEYIQETGPGYSCS